jgi:H+/Cl- antiporter ClcA
VTGVLRTTFARRAALLALVAALGTVTIGALVVATSAPDATTARSSSLHEAVQHAHGHVTRIAERTGNPHAVLPSLALALLVALGVSVWVSGPTRLLVLARRGPGCRGPPEPAGR